MNVITTTTAATMTTAQQASRTASKIFLSVLSNQTLFIEEHNFTIEMARGTRHVNSVFYKIERYLSILPIFLVIFGTIGNLVACYVLTRKKLRSQSTMIYFASLTIIDTMSLYQWNFNLFFKYQLNAQDQNLENQSMFLCVYISYMAHFCMQTSAWILAIISIDRYHIVTSSRWKQKYSRNTKFTLCVVATLVGIIGAVNFPVALTNGEWSEVFIEYKQNQQLVTVNHSNIRKVVCYNSWFYKKVYTWFTLFIECILPLALMIIYNVLLIQRTNESSVKLKKRSRANSEQNPQSKETKENNISKSVSTNSDLASKLKQRASSFVNLPSTFASNLSNNLSVENITSRLKGFSARNNSSSDCYLDSTSSLYQKFGLERHKSVCAAKRSNFLLSKKISSMKMAYSMVAIPTACKEERTSADGQGPMTDKVASHDNNDNKANFDESSSNLNESSQCIDQKSSSPDQTQVKHMKKRLSSMKFSENRYLSALDINRRSSDPKSSKQRHVSLLAKKSLGQNNNTLNDRKIRNLRNRHIVIMLSLLTLSFAISTVPSAIFYNMLKPLVKGKPYKRLVTNSFILLRHLSHAFNFIIYFTSSTLIKNELTQIVSDIKRKRKLSSFLKSLCCCLVYIFPSVFNKNTSSLQSAKYKRPSLMNSRLTLNLSRSQTIHKSNKFHEKDAKASANEQQLQQQSYEMNSSNLALNFYPEACFETAETPVSPMPTTRTNYHSILKKRGTVDSIQLEIEPCPFVQRDRASIRKKRTSIIVKV